MPRKLAGEGAVSLQNGETIERVNKRNPCVGMCHRNRAKGRVDIYPLIYIIEFLHFNIATFGKSLWLWLIFLRNKKKLGI